MKVNRCLQFLFSFLTVCGYGQNIYDARQSVFLQAKLNENPPAITLNWVLDTANGGYTVWRKSKYDEIWTDSLAVLDARSVSWVDSSIKIGVDYEYQIIKSLPKFPYGDGSMNSGAGYIYSGIKVPAIHHRGTCLVVIDSTFKQLLAMEISRLLNDLEGDGWHAQMLYVSRKDSIGKVKSGIKSWAQKNPDANQALFLLGRVPVPYSGEIAPDGHHSDHRGAWPCDGYYADLDGLWTDRTINITTAASSRNDNVPGDGKFDQNVIPGKARLQVGRVDFSNMSKFPESEEQLLRRYLDKNHDWRTGKINMVERGLVDNNFAPDPEALGQSGWKNFSPMFGISNVKDLAYRETLSKQSYIWSYGCGGGGPESASDISNTTNFTTDSLLTLFTMMFGSYFGDWDYPNNFLRGAIASRTCLASTWGNRPTWFLHHMAMGEHIGYATQLAMNNRGLYNPRFYGGYVSTVLMGDPTLRMHILRPVERLIALQDGLNIRLDWQDSIGSAGYFVYKKSSGDSTFKLLNKIPVTDHFFIDPCVEKGPINYMVRSSALKTSASGSYYNLSAGVFTSIISDPLTFSLVTQTKNADPGKSNGSIKVIPQGGCAPYSYRWDSGQTTEEIIGLTPGKYCVTVSDCMGCNTSDCASITVSNGLVTLPGLLKSKLYPNPAEDHIILHLEFEASVEIQIFIYNLQGKIFSQQICNGKDLDLKWDTRTLPEGLYWLTIRSAQGHITLPFVKIE
ncbi:MAG: T9SS type A sorting domain-containing protein [Saprospiraceae bacterium]|nr:T9SS type A sorting domain-containing protein [Candidatus Vicinibacter affinis]